MVSDTDIARSATGMIRSHGKDAAAECAVEADKLRNRGDVIGAEVWDRITQAVHAMTQGSA